MALPGSNKPPVVVYQIVQFASGEWGLEKTETRVIAWFETRAQAIAVCRDLPPVDAVRKM